MTKSGKTSRCGNGTLTFFSRVEEIKKATIDLDILQCKLILLYNDLRKQLLEGSERLRLCPCQRGQSKSYTLDDVGRGRFGGSFRQVRGGVLRAFRGKKHQKNSNYCPLTRSRAIFQQGYEKSRLILKLWNYTHEIVGCQIVTFCHSFLLPCCGLCFRVAENAGRQLFLLCKCLPQGIFQLVDAVKRPY